MAPQEPIDVFTPEEAVEYLRTKRGIILSVTSLRVKRWRNKQLTRGVKTRTTLWTKAELDAIEPTSRTKRVQEGENDENNGRALSVTPHVQRPLSPTVAA